MISLRDYLESDIDRLVELANNENVSRYLADIFPFPYTRDDAEWWISEGNSKNSAATKVIELDNEFVGAIGLTPLQGWKSHVAEIGYWVGENYWGRGIATAAIKMISENCYQDSSVSKIFAPVLGPNGASMRALAKAGYELEGILKNEVKKNGILYDIHHYALHCT